MKYACLGYIDESAWDALDDEGRAEWMDACFAYDDELRAKGHFAGGEGLDYSRNAATLRWKDGKLLITDGPFSETKEQLGGILFLEANDLNHAIQLMSKHPGVKAGPFEIRAIEDMTPYVEASRERRAAAAKGGRS